MSGTPIALLTDYGVRDSYVGVLRAVIHQVWPWATILDLCHDVPPCNVMSGAWLLASAGPWLPERCIVCAVVDPTVGSDRRAVAIETEHLRLVGPDNGLFAMLLEDDPPVRAVELDQERWFLPHRSVTFDGRDVFAPVAAQLARGVRFAALGSKIDPASLEGLDLPTTSYGDDRIDGTIVHVDRFGNSITTIRRSRLEDWLAGSQPIVETAGVRFPFVRTFADVAVHDPLAYVGSAGNLEIAVRDGDCAATYDLFQGAEVVVRRG
ncbi:MAG: SAM-dependent chlorinase/fluorinase [Planctomycetes bacterium]|nr:SAM-dependent chlorinase/fluorinase [Planctomycetota bacterium]